MSIGSRWSGSVIRCLGLWIGAAPELGATLLPFATDAASHQLENAG